jgi:nicotinamidase-related amidase
MTTLSNRPHTALLIVDMQEAVIDKAHAREAVVANILNLVDRARAEGVPVLWVQHQDTNIVKDSPGWRIAAQLKPSAVEPVIEKSYGDAFEDTTLESVLSELRVGRLIIVGAETDACIRCTLHGAFVRGYDALLVSDAHTTGDKTKWGAPAPAQVIAHTNLYWKYQTAPGRTAGAIATDQVEFRG